MRFFLLFFKFNLLITLFCSCKGETTVAENQTGKIIANVENTNFYDNDLNEVAPSGINKKDSSAFAKKAIEDWAIETLFYNEALEKLNKEEITIDKQVEDYKKQLVNHIYQTKLIEANLDTNVSKPEIENYYNNNKESFVLVDNIVKVNYFKIPLKAVGLEKIKRLVNATSEKDKQQLNTLCSQYAENYFTNDSTWLYTEDLKKEIPMLKQREEINLSKGKTLELTDEFYYYYLKIKDEKLKNTLSPINFEINNIKIIIVNNRKTLLIQQYKKQLLENGLKEKRVNIK